MSIFTSITMQFVEGTNAYNLNDFISINIDEKNEEVTFKGFMNKKKPIVHLPLNKLLGVKLESEQEIIEKSKSVVGRAAIGLVAGPLGAIIGGMSGIGKKKKKGKEKVILTIEYTDGQLVFIGDKSIAISDFYKRLKKHLPSIETKDGHITL